MLRSPVGKAMRAGRAKKAPVFAVALVVAAAAMAVSLLVVVGTKPAEAAFPGNNGRIAFQSDRDGPLEIYTISASGGAATRITFPPGGNSEAAYSPDGSRIAFNRGNDIHVMSATGMNPDGTGSRRLTSRSATEMQPTWSPDGTRIAFVANTVGPGLDGQTDYEIWVMNADGTGQRPLTANTYPESQPAWSPDGSKIAFESSRRFSPFFDTDQNIYVMDANGANQTNITPNLSDPESPYQGHDAEPAWSPNGTKIAYVHTFFPNAGGVPNIWTMDPNGANKVNLSNNRETSAVMPAWSPSGDKIAYVGSESTDRNIHVMDANGANQRAIDTDTAHDINPDWQPIPRCTKTGTSGNNTITGTPAKDVICALGGDDTINGAGGNDIILGGEGNDRLIGGLGNDTINGGPGNDTALYSGSTRVIANLTTEFATGGVGSDVLLGVENLTGSGANDRLTGSAVRNQLIGGAGADNMFGLAGNDALNSRDGVNGNDTLSGGPGTDTKITDATEKSIVGFP